VPEKSEPSLNRTAIEFAKLVGSIVLGAFLSGASLLLWADTHFATKAELTTHVNEQNTYQGVRRDEFNALRDRVDSHMREDNALDKRLLQVEIVQRSNNRALAQIGKKLGVYVDQAPGVTDKE
jgi:hypothetical protein